MKILLKILAIMAASYLLAAQAVKAQNDIELQCRTKAKEVAVQTYSGCVSENRRARLNEIRAGYKAEVATVKAKYDQLLKELENPGQAKPAAAPKPRRAAKAPAVKPRASTRAEKPAPGVPRTLPAKQNDNGPALPIAVPHSETAVIAPAGASQDTENTPEPEMIEVY